jgi:predicted kinase
MFVRGRLVVFCGIPGSGKSTIAHLVAKMSMPSVQLQTDGVRNMIAEPTYSPEESEFVYQACVAAAKVALDMGYLTILDGTFGSRRRREGALSALEGHYSSANVVHVVCGLEAALQRNSRRRKPVPEENLRGIMAGFDIPEGAITVDTSKMEAEEAARIVLEAINLLVAPGSMTA